MKEVLKLQIDNALVRIPKRWIEDNIPSPDDFVQVMREIDADRIIITLIQPKEGADNGSTGNLQDRAAEEENDDAGADS